MDRILIVDDDRSIRELLSMHLRSEVRRRLRGLPAPRFPHGRRDRTGRDRARHATARRVGHRSIPELKKHAAEAPVLMITAHHDMATTILAIKAGAFDSTPQAIDIQAFDVALDGRWRFAAFPRHRLPVGGGGRAFKMDDIVGTSPTMQQLFKDVGPRAASRATVLIQGETGTGKELIARVIQATALRRSLHRHHCSPSWTRFSSTELFGHEKGPSRARPDQEGQVRACETAASSSTRIGELSQNLQAKLPARPARARGGAGRRRPADLSIKARILGRHQPRPGGGGPRGSLSWDCTSASKW